MNKILLPGPGLFPDLINQKVKMKKNIIVISMLFTSLPAFSMFNSTDRKIKKIEQEIEVNQHMIDGLSSGSSRLQEGASTVITIAAPFIAEKATRLIIGKERMEEVDEFKERHPYIYKTLMFIASLGTKTLLENIMGIK